MESPMEYQWTTGPKMDPASPFSHLGMESKKRTSQSAPTRKQSWDRLRRQHPNPDVQIGTHSAFESPDKKTVPHLRAPNSQPFYFSQQQQPASPAAKSVFGQPAFTTPRKFDVDVDFSSGAENMSSPDNADNEDTPDAKAGQRNSLYQMYGRFAPSPGRGEIPRAKNYSNALARRVEKRRRRDKELGRQVRVDSDDDSDRPSSSEGRKEKSKKQLKGSDSEPPQSRMSKFSEFFVLLERHPNIPSILSWWAQLFVNLSLFSLAVYVVFSVVSTIRAEFEQAAQGAKDEILETMSRCADNYLSNKCASDERLPALKDLCMNWDQCMNQDPDKVGRAKVSAQTMAMIINSFIDPISWKAFMFFLASIATVTVVSNLSFRSFRKRLNQQTWAPPNYQQPHNPQLHPPPLHQNPSYGYYPHEPHQIPNSYTEKEPQLMLEGPRMDFVTERSRERESQLRTPSPSKRGRRFA
ncbi:nucleus export protein BRR6 [Penicillium atrosanguineum]|uniref:Nucleus export protein BRR6 n=1 Tax=Penicillium atrosanguineum TaxID=1132637 RepID=A0A9W9TZB5_9EURO|nr:nucleus export protein BRR6 [Penicillium atrosanguineum]